ncbi:hypothetical protein P691DRAFT_761236 [Macrolepiota fuliginosa MF-IS2]|uniref:Uncharacterized protein n=1 Tax=Macrolepiota fuliginosa MF-IS2 TaxID=1400762 RepID=A0A9P5XBC8_9AGAR|nr:hypothetical protein P691DRAFT_761236 [Macrolepiota fuliginosa MF-IS2]
MLGFHLFGCFPEDIRRLIFEVAFEEGYPRANHLALVSREISSWIQPLIYRHVVLDTPDDEAVGFTKFIDTFRNGSKNKAFYTNHVKAIFVSDFIFENFAAEFLPLCRNLVSLSCWPNRRSQLEAKSTITSILKPQTFPSLRKFSLTILPDDALPELVDIFHHPLTQNLTHLDLLLGTDLSWDDLKYIHCLQYLSIHPIVDVWLPSNPGDAGNLLEALVNKMIVRFPPELRSLIIWLPAGRLLQAACEDARAKLQTQSPIYANIVHGWLDSRVILASCADQEMDWGAGMSDFMINEVTDFLDQTIMVVSNEFDTRLIWDDAAEQGTSEFWRQLEGILRRRREAVTRIRSSHWHQGSYSWEKEMDTTAPSIRTEFRLFSAFPEDIRRLIFEIAFGNGNTPVNNLALVSREIHSWIEPLIYRHVVLFDSSFPRPVEQFLRTVSNRGLKDRKYYASLIQSLFVNRSAAQRLGSDFLPLCDNLTSFAGPWLSWGSEPAWDDVLQSILKGKLFPQLRKLSLQGTILTDLYKYLDLRSLTHLDIALGGPAPWGGLEMLLNLKHIRVDALKQVYASGNTTETGRIVRESIQTAVQHFPPSLESFVFLVDANFILDAVWIDCESKTIQGGPPIFADILCGEIDPRVVLSCRGVPLLEWSKQRLSQRQIDEIYDNVNQVVPCHPLYLPWDPDAPFGIQNKDSGFYWLDIVESIIHRRKEVSDAKRREEELRAIQQPQIQGKIREETDSQVPVFLEGLADNGLTD